MVEQSRLKILIADDASVMRMLLRVMLTRFVHAEIAEAKDGASALKMASECTYDMVFLDINMPNMNGLSVLDALRRTDVYKLRPIVLLTSMGQEKHRERGLALGASAYVLKPLREMELVRTLMKLAPEALRAKNA